MVWKDAVYLSEILVDVVIATYKVGEEKSHEFSKQRRKTFIKIV